jgi:hypothetical protein
MFFFYLSSLMSLLLCNPINILINTDGILKLDNIYGLPSNVISYFSRIKIFVSTLFKSTNYHGGKGGLNSFLPVLSPS